MYMPYYFNYYNPNNGEKIFQKKLHTGICQGISKNGQRCSRKSCIGFEYCYTHLLSVKHLRIKESNIPNAGKGLFALNKNEPENAIIFKKNEKIVNYNGEMINNRERMNRYQGFNAPYAVELSNNNIVDSATKRGVASTSNHTNRSRSNAKLSVDNRNKVVSIKATKNILNGEEILINYGNSYTFDNNFNTKPYKTKN